MKVDSHARQILVGNPVRGGGLRRRKDGICCHLDTEEGAVVLRRVSIYNPQGQDLLAQPDDQQLEALLMDALPVALEADGEAWEIRLENGARIYGYEPDWAPVGRTLKLIGHWEARGVDECGCVQGQGDLPVSRCAEHQAQYEAETAWREAQGAELPWQEVDGGVYRVVAGKCEQCGDTVAPIADWTFGACSCARDQG